MHKTDSLRKGVLGILEKAKLYNGSIGAYEEHYYNERLNFTIKLNNGNLEITEQIARQMELIPFEVSESEIEKLANSFVPKNFKGLEKKLTFSKLFGFSN